MEQIIQEIMNHIAVINDEVGGLHKKEGLGEYDLNKIEILGNKLEECRYERKFKLHSTIEEQLKWKA